MIFETSKFFIAVVRFILGKVWVDRYTGPRQEIDIRYEFDLKLLLKYLECKWRLFQPFLIEFPSSK